MKRATGLDGSNSVETTQIERARTKDGIALYLPEDFVGMRAAGRVAAEALDMIGQYVEPGVSTLELDAKIHDFVIAAGAKSATIGYVVGGFTYQHASCISLNHVVCHGIPSDKRLKSGDILNIDVTVVVDGWHGDTSRMYVAGEAPRRAERLIDITHEALMRGVDAVRPGASFGDIGHAIQSYVEGQRCSVVRKFCGHGLGRVFHDAPSVLHYGRPGSGPVIEPGMFFTIEPMVNIGRHETKFLSDNWTVVTRDRSLSAQFEHSVGVSEDGVEVFTLSPAGLFYPTQPRSSA